MENNKSKWYEILEASNALGINSIIQNGHIQYVNLIEDRSIWHIYVMLEKPVPSGDIFAVMERVTKYLYSISDVKLVKFS